MENTKNKVFCHDCRQEIKIKEKEIENGKFLVYEQEGKKIEVFKCDACFAKNQSLTHFQPCEVYSRVVGYLRPVSQWNIGKKLEYKKRKEYNPEFNCKC